MGATVSRAPGTVDQETGGAGRVAGLGGRQGLEAGEGPGGMTNQGIQVGERAPDFSLPASGGGRLRLGDLLEAGTTVVLVFYPLDFSPK
jgi:hypothetical protein